MRQSVATSLSLLLLCESALCQDLPSDRIVIAQAVDQRDVGGNDGRQGVVASAIYVVFHSGSFDAFDIGRPADEAMRAFADEGVTEPLKARLAAVDPNAKLVQLFASGLSQGRFDANNAVLDFEPRITPRVDARHHRYVSFLAKLSPSDDAFVGNDDPRKYPLFDDRNRFLGPHAIKVSGDDVLDAGTRENSEENLQWLDRSQSDVDLNAGTPTQELIGKHPGFNGSLRNPTGQPVRVLGGLSFTLPLQPPLTFNYIPELTDFTLPGAKLFTLRITSGPHAGYSGFWNSPTFSGEGFQFSIFDLDGVPQLGVAWYTFRPDGSGEQAFLFGFAPVGLTGAWVPLTETEGGRFASPDNPQNVQAKPWGRIRVTFESPACRFAAIDAIEPLDPAWLASGAPTEYLLRRTVPPSREAQDLCGGYLLPYRIF